MFAAENVISITQIFEASGFLSETYQSNLNIFSDLWGKTVNTVQIQVYLKSTISYKSNSKQMQRTVENKLKQTACTHEHPHFI